MTLFADLELGLVSKFPLDYMHLVCLGITRKLIYLWLNGPLVTRLPHRLVMLISEDLISIRPHIPSEFARKPRSLKEVAMWKATKHRQFLLYTGMVVLRAKVSSAIYNNFLLLFICMRVLLSEEGIIDIDYTKQLLVSFVTNAATIYGKQILVYNMHNIWHIVDDVKMYGRLDNVSCFPYENALGQLKRLVKKPQHPIAQIVRRLNEQGQQHGPQNTEFLLHMQHYSGPIIFEYSH